MIPVSAIGVGPGVHHDDSWVDACSRRGGAEEDLAQVEDAFQSEAELANRGFVAGLAADGDTVYGLAVFLCELPVVTSKQAGTLQQGMSCGGNATAPADLERNSPRIIRILYELLNDVEIVKVPIAQVFANEVDDR